MCVYMCVCVCVYIYKCLSGAQVPSAEHMTVYMYIYICTIIMPIFYCISIVVRFKLLLDATIIKHRTTVNKCLTSANGVLVLNGRLTKRSTNEFYDEIERCDWLLGGIFDANDVAKRRQWKFKRQG